jgi:hypothetical protein
MGREGYRVKDRLADICSKGIGLVELLIGGMTFLTLIQQKLFYVSDKPASVFVMVLISGLISAILGLGILIYKNWARVLLVFFSGYVLFLKVLLYTGIIRFTGELLTVPSPYIRDSVSAAYHIFVIVFFLNRDIALRFK